MVDLDDDTAAAICGVQVCKLLVHFGKGEAEQIGSTTKVKLCDSGINCERLGRHLPGPGRRRPGAGRPPKGRKAPPDKPKPAREIALKKSKKAPPQNRN